MKDQKLMTLKQVADQIGVNYKTIHHYRDVFEEFMMIQFAGRRVKYLPENADLFCKILELKDEGHSNEDIREILKVRKSNDLKIYLSDDPTIETSDDLDVCPSISPTVSISDVISDDLEVYLSVHPSDCLDIFLSEEPSIDISEHLTDPPSDLPSDPPSDLLTDSPTDHPTDIHSDICDRVTGLFFEYLKEIFGHLETTLQKSTTQSNIAITALCESTQDIRNGLLSINDRLARLERDLDVEAAEPLEIYEVDARNYQVELPEITLPDITPPSAADLEPGMEPTPETTPDSTPQDLSDDHDLGSVRDSIDNGIPDRDVLVDWAMEKRQQDENTYSYNVLAGILNKSAIPTMSGREKWSRSTVRNLLVRTLKNRE